MRNLSTPLRKKKLRDQKFFFLCLFINFCITFVAQNTNDYYIELEESANIGTINKTSLPNGRISISSNNSSFSSFINTKEPISLEKAYPTAITPRLQRIYRITLDSSTVTNDFTNRSEIVNLREPENVSLDTEMINPIALPNDYLDPITGVCLPALELIKAPLAWTITTGDPNILVGVADSSFDFNHYDLQGKFVDNLLIFENNISHGTGSAGKIAGNTNNNQGISSLAYNTRLVGATCGGFAAELIDGLLQLSRYPGVKVINCSWSISENSNFKSDLDMVMQEIINENNVLVLGSAGNGNDVERRYPGAYDEAISVTSVGSRFPIGYLHNLQNPDGERYWNDSWKDCHYKRPRSNSGGHTRSDKVDVVAPGYLITSTTDRPEFPDGYRIASGTSGAVNYVSALAALIFSVNSSFTPEEVRDIIKNTADDIYYIPSNQDFIGQLGTGRINAYRAVLTADCMTNPTPGLDLAMQNSKLDSFEEPDTGTLQPWQSEDIWVRNQNDGILVRGEHQNPEYDPNNPNYAYVQVTNNSCVTSSGNDVLKLYWAKASTSLAWPDPWDGSVTIYDEVDEVDVLMGDEIGSMSIPSLEIGQSTILEFPWNVPNPADYENINNAPWHFCLLARIESPDDPMTTQEGSFLTDNVLNNNNIAWKNMTIVDIEPNSTTISAALAVGNPSNLTNSYTVNFSEEVLSQGKALYDEAEITIEMDDTFYNAWDTGGRQSNDTNPASIAANNRKHRVIGNSASFNNVQLAPGEIGTLTFSFNFLIDEMTTKKKFIYHVEQIDQSTNKLLGGETFIVNKQTRDSFAADSGDDKDIERNESATITAAQINEAAIYNWYDPEGNLIYTGPTLTVSPEVTKTYRLEVISDSDGYKDYDEVTVNVAPYHLDTLVPNPATNSVTVSYVADQATSAYLMVVGTNNNTSNNYILDTELTSINLDISSYPTGIYAVALVCDGDIVDSKQLIKQ